MVIGIVASLAAVAGIVFGALRRNRMVVSVSVVVLALVLAVWAFFWFNPY